MPVSRKLLYFCIGLLIPFFAVCAFCDECTVGCSVCGGDAASVAQDDAPSALASGYPLFIGNYTSESELNSALNAITGTSAGLAGYTSGGCKVKNVTVYVTASRRGYWYGVVCPSCDPPPEPDKYFVDSYCVCTDTGDGIYFAYGQCQDEVPSGDITVIGNTKLYTSIKSEIPVDGLNAQCASPGGGCAYEMQDINEMIASLAPSWGADCGTDFDDDDGDGVANEDDNCPMTPEGSTVDQFGCSLPDSDDDGVDDDHDSCPDTPVGTEVDSFGCPVDDDDDDDDVPDSDGDGVDDDHDSCPDTPAGTTVGPDGCPPPPDPGDGDNDDDNELLSDIVDWLKNISGTADTVSKNVADIESVNRDVLDAQRQTTNKIQDQIDEQKETNDELDDANDTLTAIKTAIMNQDSKLSGIESNTGKLADLVEDDDSRDSSWSGVDASEYNDGNFATDFVEGTDFETAPEISENTGISNFLTSNPLKTALDASGFDLSGSCSYSVDLGSVFGSKTIDICSLESVFDSAGMIFYGLSILSGLLMIARGF